MAIKKYFFCGFPKSCYLGNTHGGFPVTKSLGENLENTFCGEIRKSINQSIYQEINKVFDPIMNIFFLILNESIN